MSTDTTLSPRQRLVETLAGDLNAQGWDQKNKLWFVKGDANDEWFEFAEEFSGPPENHLVDIIAADQPHEGITGVVVSTEGWAYPKSLTDTFKTEAQLRSYWRLVPPNEHPEKTEIRHLLMAASDGEVIGLIVHRNDDSVREWARLTADNASPTGDRTVDAARALLGLHDPLKQRVLKTFKSTSSADGDGGSMVSALDQIQKVLKTVQKVMDGSMTDHEATMELFYSMPEEARVSMIRDMPELVKETFRKHLSAEEQEKYGL